MHTLDVIQCGAPDFVHFDIVSFAIQVYVFFSLNFLEGYFFLVYNVSERVSLGLAELVNILYGRRWTGVMDHQVRALLPQAAPQVQGAVHQELSSVGPRLGEVEVPGPLVVGGVEAVERHHEVTQLVGGHQSLVIMEAEVIPEQAYHCPQLGHGSEIRNTIYWLA